MTAVMTTRTRARTPSRPAPNMAGTVAHGAPRRLLQGGVFATVSRHAARGARGPCRRCAARRLLQLDARDVPGRRGKRLAHAADGRRLDGLVRAEGFEHRA